MMKKEIENKIEISTEPLKVSRRIAVFPADTPVKFQKEFEEEKLVQTFPNLIIREVICFQLVVILVTLISLFVDAPLEEIANPMNTPNPAKAPWYFLGLQELLHSFPPFIAGIAIPGLVVIALIIIPYFNINVKRNGLWEKDKYKKFIYLSVNFGIITLISIIYSAYGILFPSLIIFILMLLPFLFSSKNKFVEWLLKKSLAEWLMSWFILMAAVLTLIGTFFRGPGWSWVWPW